MSLRASIALGAAVVLAGCALEPPPGLTDVMQRPGERALLAGLRAYEDAQYADAERELQRALGVGLASAKDRAAAHKHLAFIYCTSNRRGACEAAFRAAIAADREFVLSRAEAGHPQWGPVYRRIAAER
ncbi:MAG TPA: TssQ family T6SS-associated lipoprotein [Burkholderiaceae bacterium]|nr:TssQ family T6SS-associated lipoprotein [Burkholderiaceae bacterium]